MLVKTTGCGILLIYNENELAGWVWTDKDVNMVSVRSD